MYDVADGVAVHHGGTAMLSSGDNDAKGCSSGRKGINVSSIVTELFGVLEPKVDRQAGRQGAQRGKGGWGRHKAFDEKCGGCIGGSKPTRRTTE